VNKQIGIRLKESEQRSKHHLNYGGGNIHGDERIENIYVFK
jgi:hypothetical protein